MNSWDSPHSYKILSSDESLMKILNNFIELEPKEEGVVRIEFCRRNESISVVVYLFINDHNDENEDCYQLHLHWN